MINGERVIENPIRWAMIGWRKRKPDRLYPPFQRYKGQKLHAGGRSL